MNANRELRQKGDFTRIAASLVAAGTAHAAAEKLDNLRFEQGDASDLPAGECQGSDPQEVER